MVKFTLINDTLMKLKTMDILCLKDGAVGKLMKHIQLNQTLSDLSYLYYISLSELGVFCTFYDFEKRYFGDLSVLIIFIMNFKLLILISKKLFKYT